MAAALAIGASTSARPAAAAAEACPMDPAPPALVPVAQAAPDVTEVAETLHGLPPEVFALRLESLAGLLASR